MSTTRNRTEYEVSNIIKGSHIPAKVRVSSKPRKLNPIAERMSKLGVNQSFLIRGVSLKKVHPLIHQAKTKLGIPIVTRTVGEDVQVWRVPDESSKSAKAH